MQMLRNFSLTLAMKATMFEAVPPGMQDTSATPMAKPRSRPQSLCVRVRGYPSLTGSLHHLGKERTTDLERSQHNQRKHTCSKL
eukprot:1159376-Pelagomonas_calceolata.AAC.3